MHGQDLLNSISTITGESDTGYRVTILRYLNKYYKQLEFLLRFPEFIGESSITIPAPYTTGTISATQGSSTITGAGTVFVAGYVGWRIKIEGMPETYRVIARASDTSITIDTAWIQASVSGKKFWLWKSNYLLPADFNKILSITSGDIPIQVRVRSIEQSDNIWKSFFRIETGSPMQVYIYKNAADYDNETTTQLSQMVVLPVPDGDYQLILKYWRQLSKIADTTASYPVFEDARLDEYIIDRVCARVFLDKEDSRSKIYFDEANETLSVLKQYFENTAGDDDRFILETGGGNDEDMIERVANNPNLV